MLVDRWGWTEHFYEGETTSTAEVPARYTVGFNGRGFYIELDQYVRRTLPQLRPGTDDGGEQGEQSFSNEGVWKRSQTDWRHGAGQLRFDDEADRDRSRFRSSFNLDPWTEGEIKLHRATTERVNSAATNLAILSVNGFLVWVDGVTVKSCANVDMATSVTTHTGLGGGSVTGMTTDGRYAYVCDGANVYRVTPGTAAVGAAVHTANAEKVWWANGRLLARVNETLVELSVDGTTATVIIDHYSPDFDWSAVVGIAGGIIAAGYAGTRGEVHFIGIDETTGALEDRGIATPLPPTEIVHSLETSGGIVFFGTDRGLRAALVNGETLDYGRVIETPGPVRCITAEDDFVWFGWEDFDATYGGLGRLYLGAFGDDEGLVFAYATDVMAAVTGDVLSCVRFGDRSYFAVSGDGFYGTTTDYAATGWFTTGAISYGTVESKAMVSLDIDHQALSGAGAAIAITEAHGGNSTDVGTSDDTGSLGPTEAWSIGGDLFEHAELTFTFTRGGTTATPVLTRWTLRSLPAGTPIEEIIVPIRLAWEVRANLDPTSSDYFKPVEDFIYLKGLERDRSVITYQELGLSLRCRIDRIEWKPTGYTQEGDLVWFEGIALVRLLTEEA